MAYKKADTITVERRTQVLFNLVRDGLQKHEIEAYVDKHRYLWETNPKTGKLEATSKPDPLWKDFTLTGTHSMLREYLEEVKKRFIALANYDAQEEFGKSKSRYEMMMAMSMQKQDVFNGVSVAKRLDVIIGNEKPKQIELDNKTSELTDEELESLLTKLIRKATLRASVVREAKPPRKKALPNRSGQLGTKESPLEVHVDEVRGSDQVS